jgi:TctA family transporter
MPVSASVRPRVGGVPGSAIVAVVLSVLVMVGLEGGPPLVRARYEDGWEGFGPFLVLMAVLAVVQCVAIAFGLAGLKKSRRQGTGAGVVLSLAPAVSLLWMVFYWAAP